MKTKTFYSLATVIFVISAYFSHMHLEQKINVLDTKISSFDKENKLLISSINYLLDNTKFLSSIPTSTIPKPKQYRDLEKYPFPAMYLHYLEKNGKKIRQALIEESKKVQKEIISMDILVPPLKSESDKGLNRVKEKAIKDYSGDLKKMKDIIRGSQVFQNLSELKQGFELLKKSDVFEIEYINNRFDNPAEGGYRDLVLFVRHKESKILAELQLHLCSIINAKKEAHGLYEEIRSIKGTAKIQQRSFTKEEQATVAMLLKESKDIYGAAYLKSIAGEKCVPKSKKYLV